MGMTRETAAAVTKIILVSDRPERASSPAMAIRRYRLARLRLDPASAGTGCRDDRRRGLG
jgi:hypothetical protein